MSSAKIDTLAIKDECFVLCNTCTNPITYTKSELDKMKCSRCGLKYKKITHKDSHKTLIFTLTALILYIPANIFPFMTLEMYGNRTESNIWQGIITLSHGKNWPLAVIVFLASMLIPFIKLVALFYLSFTAKNGKNKEFKTKLHRFIETIGPWSMLDIFLLAVLVAVIKFGSMASVTVGTGSFMFLFVVIFTILASSSFDPKVIWQEEKNESDSK